MGAKGFLVYPRFIPTYAGSSDARSPADLARSVHPHVRGEQATAMTEAQIRAGSSPRTRGAAQRFEHGALLYRFIPTYAGSRSSKAL